MFVETWIIIVRCHGLFSVRKNERDDKYTDEEAQRRFEAALRGAREVGHEPMKDISPKRAKPQAKASMTASLPNPAKAKPSS
jgi:hypothetical protein